MANAHSDELLTAAELAERLKVKAQTILDWHRKGRIPARKLSHKVIRFDLSEVMAALESAAHEADGQGGGHE